jgi:hypothetical protein
MYGEISDKKRGQLLFWSGPQTRKEGYEERGLSRLPFQIVDELLVGLTFVNHLTLPFAYFNMDFRATLSLITNEITHAKISSPDPENWAPTS